MDSLPGASTSASASGSTSSTTANSTELMIALSQIQQLIPLLDYRPGGLTHLLPTLLTPLLPTNDAVPGESMQRYRANVDHAFRVAGELVGRVQDGAPVGNALDLADRLMRSGDEKARVLRVRKKRRLFVEQEKVLEVNSWGPPVPLRANIAAKGVDAQKKEAEGTADKVVEVSAFLPSQNPPNTVLAASQQNLPQPTTAQAVQKYFGALHAYLQTTLDRGLAPQTVPLKHVKARIAAFSQQGLTLEVQVAQVIKGRIDASFMYGKVATAENVGAEDGGEGELERVEVAALTLGGVNESITSTTPSAYPIFRSLSTDVLAQTQRATSSLPSPQTSPADRRTWTAYTPVTEAVTRIILAAAQFQS